MAQAGYGARRYLPSPEVLGTEVVRGEPVPYPKPGVEVLGTEVARGEPASYPESDGGGSGAGAAALGAEGVVDAGDNVSWLPPARFAPWVVE